MSEDDATEPFTPGFLTILWRLKESDPTLSGGLATEPGVSMKYEHCRALAEALRSNFRLRILCLGFSNLGDNGCIAFANALCQNTSIRVLSLPWTGIRDTEGLSIANMLRKNTTLCRLDLAFNKLGDTTGKAIAVALRTNTTLRWLNLGGTNLGNDTAQALIGALYMNTTICILRLEATRIDDSILNHIDALLAVKARHARRDWKPHLHREPDTDRPFHQTVEILLCIKQTYQSQIPVPPRIQNQT